MLLFIVFQIALFVSTPVLASEYSDAAQAARETRSLYEAQKQMFEDELSLDIQEHDECLYGHYQSTTKEALSAAKEIVDSANQFDTKERRQAMFEKGTIVGGISNKLFADAEEARRNQLGLEREDQLYIFISRSMPDDLIRAYALDAAYSGGILVMKGIGEDEKLGDFLRGEYMRGIKPDGMGAMVQLDPRLFDAFDVSVVPSIVYTNQSLADLCNNNMSSVHHCQEVSDDSYYKLAGNVTLKYALEQFIQAGAGEGAERFIKTLKHGYQTGDVENPNKASGLSLEDYKTYLSEITGGETINSEYVFEGDSSILKMGVVNTPFGQIEAPIGTELMLKNVGSITTVFDAEVQGNE